LEGGGAGLNLLPKEQVTTRILLADDHQLIRAGLRALLEAEPGVQVVAEAGDGRTAVRLAAELSPDVVVMDISMLGLNGIEATRQIRAGRNGNGNRTGPKVIALSGHSDRRMVTEMLKAGGSGYIPKESAFEEVALALRTVMSNKVYLSPAVADVVVEDFSRGKAAGDASAFDTLTPREREVLQLVAEGKATKQVAMVLHVSIKTVETHRKNIMEKLGIDSVAELTKYAIREGLTSP
jgi:DNA-binding NarL/FixJ family response regulator